MPPRGSKKRLPVPPRAKKTQPRQPRAGRKYSPATTASALPKKYKARSMKQTTSHVKRKGSYKTRKFVGSTNKIPSTAILASLFDKVHYQAIAAREFELSAVTSNTPGLVPLLYASQPSGSNSLGVLPVHVYDLSCITHNDGLLSNMNPGRTLGIIGSNASYHNFHLGTNTPTLYLNTINDGGSFESVSDSSNNSFNRTIWQNFDVRLDLYQREKYSTDYTISLMKFDDDVIPDFSDQLTTSNINPIFNSFWREFARPTYTNSLVPVSTRLSQDLGDKSTVIWKRTYHLPEKNTLVDSFDFKRVKIFKTLNKLLRYNETPAQGPMANDDPNSFYSAGIALAPYNSFNTNITRKRDRIFLVIQANSTVDGYAINDAAVAANTDVPSYNFFMRTKHLVATAGNS